MLGAIKQIVVSYEQQGMTPDEIAEDQQLDVVAVKAALSQHSSMYRKDVDHIREDSDEGLDFTKEQLRLMNQVIFDAAISATLPDNSVDHRTRLKAAQYIRDDFKGRLTPVRAIHKNVTNNMFQINEAIQQARLGVEQAKRQLTERAAYGQDSRCSTGETDEHNNGPLRQERSRESLVNETSEQRALSQDCTRETSSPVETIDTTVIQETELVTAR